MLIARWDKDFECAETHPFPSELRESWFEGEADALLAALIRHDLVRDATEATFVAPERRVIRLTNASGQTICFLAVYDFESRLFTHMGDIGFVPDLETAIAVAQARVSSVGVLAAHARLVSVSCLPGSLSETDNPAGNLLEDETFLAPHVSFHLHQGCHLFSPGLAFTRDGHFVSELFEFSRFFGQYSGLAARDGSAGRILSRVPRWGPSLPGMTVPLLPFNYGHSLVQRLPVLRFIADNLVMLRRLGPISLVSAGLASDPLIAEVMAELGIAEEVDILDFNNIAGNELTCAHVLTTSLMRVDREFRWNPWLYDTIGRFRQPTDPNAPRGIFISRRDVDNRRGLANEEELIDFLNANGVAIDPVVCTGLTFLEQRRLFSNARLVVTPHGSGLNNAYFSNHRPMIVELTHDALGANRYWFRNLSALFTSEYALLNGSFVGNEPDFHAQFRISTDSLVPLLPHMRSRVGEKG